VSATTDPHERAERAHRQAAQRHDRAAVFWTEQGDRERAELERRNVTIEEAAAELERDRAALARRRPPRGVAPTEP